jgi:hypothetical protein
VPAIAFDNTYARELEGFHVPWKPAAVPEPRLLFLNWPLAEELGLELRFGFFRPSSAQADGPRILGCCGGLGARIALSPLVGRSSGLHDAAP